MCDFFLKNGKWCWASIQKSPVLRMMENCWVYPWPVSRELLPNTPKLLSGLMSTQCCQTFRCFEGSQNLDFALWHFQIVRCCIYVYMKPKHNRQGDCQSMISAPGGGSDTSFKELGNGQDGGWHWFLIFPKITDYIKYLYLKVSIT